MTVVLYIIGFIVAGILYWFFPMPFNILIWAIDMAIVDPLPIADEVYFTFLLLMKVIKYYKRGLWVKEKVKILENKLYLVISVLSIALTVGIIVLSFVECISCVSCQSCVSCDSCCTCHSCDSQNDGHNWADASRYDDTEYERNEQRRLEKEFSDDPV